MKVVAVVEAVEAMEAVEEHEISGTTADSPKASPMRILTNIRDTENKTTSIARSFTPGRRGTQDIIE